MSWSFRHVAKAGEILRLVGEASAATTVTDEKERDIRSHALAIVIAIAGAHDPEENLQVEAFGSMFSQADKPPRYSLKIAVQPHPVG